MSAPLQTDGIDKSNQQTQIARVGFDKAKGMDYPGGLFLLGDDYLSSQCYQSVGEQL
jgi:hypothetical protein